MDTHDRQDCEMDIKRIHELIDSGIFEPKNMYHVLRVSAFIDLMICLRDLMHKTEKYDERISFTDDILMNEYVKDVTDAITAVRDACCHMDTSKREFDTRGNRGIFNVVYGKDTLMKIVDLELKSDYEDDIAFFYGKNRLYYKRHIIRAFEEAKGKLTPLMVQRPA